jgi:hypothetical protein
MEQRPAISCVRRRKRNDDLRSQRLFYTNSEELGGTADKSIRASSLALQKVDDTT